MTEQKSGQNPGARVAALVGPYSSGKTTLFEDILFAAEAIPRRGTVKDGSTLGDASPEARARNMSTELNIASFDYLDESWTVIDCPGSVELVYDAQCAMMVADIVIVVCDPKPERVVTLSPILQFLDDRSIPHLIYINKLDQEEASVRATFEALQTISSRPLLLREIPIRDGSGQLTGMVDLVSERAWRWEPHKRSEMITLPKELEASEDAARGEMLESLADFDDDLMMELLEDVVPSTDEIYENLVKDLQADLIVPVFFGSAENENGINRLMKALRHEAPDASTTAARLGLPTDGAVAQVFSTAYAGKAGKLSHARVWSGAVNNGDSLNGSRVASLRRHMGSKSDQIQSAAAGEIVSLGRMGEVQTGELLTETGGVVGDWPTPPAPLFSIALQTQHHADEVRLSAALTRLSETDPSLYPGHNSETGELILAGQGAIQLQIALKELEADSGLTLTQTQPEVPFKETITKGMTQKARHKKQSGGHGEFADVEIEIRPLSRGEGFAFDDRIVGGAVPKQYIPAVEKGVREYLQKGPNGHPIVDVAVTLVDGGHHNVDSSDMAFQRAAIKAMSEAMPHCKPIVLEPIHKVSLSVPAEFTPKVQRIVSGRRGQLLGFDAKPGWSGWDEVQALIPLAEMTDIVTELRSVSLGVGTHVSEFDHLQQVSR
ncbi:elongation factor G [Aliiroseovarius sp. KMU-50]|uniref:Elongation factor G n=1 Tax=Aliiroseovarius salicola TaxID=3009082 RepID=A0ABT4VZY7_9RHOB|nr:elongation factor G [Aliiroseovarius sp. KMU-50]MDA5093093.1 elongation factor G [Aliiroseovarius sp. KMU-50]